MGRRLVPSVLLLVVVLVMGLLGRITSAAVVNRVEDTVRVGLRLRVGRGRTGI